MEVIHFDELTEEGCVFEIMSHSLNRWTSCNYKLIVRLWTENYSLSSEGFPFYKKICQNREMINFEPLCSFLIERNSLSRLWKYVETKNRLDFVDFRTILFVTQNYMYDRYSVEQSGRLIFINNKTFFTLKLSEEAMATIRSFSIEPKDQAKSCKRCQRHIMIKIQWTGKMPSYGRQEEELPILGKKPRSCRKIGDIHNKKGSKWEDFAVFSAFWTEWTNFKGFFDLWMRLWVHAKMKTNFVIKKFLLL